MTEEGRLTLLGALARLQSATNCLSAALRSSDGPVTKRREEALWSTLPPIGPKTAERGEAAFEVEGPRTRRRGEKVWS
jgi:hypothetical protein